MNKYKCLIVDDERLAQELLENYILKIPCLVNVSSCFSCMEAMPFLAETEIDILFLDVQMPEMSGIDFLHSLKNTPATILTTAYSEYALESYELAVTDYLLKPIEFDRFFKAVFKALDGLQRRLDPKETLSETTVPPSLEGYFFVHADKKTIRVQFDDVLFIEALQKYIRIHTVDERIITLLSLSKIQELLPANSFIRIHRSYIINIDKIDRVEAKKVTIKNHQLPISKGQKKNFMQVLKNKRK